MKDGDFPDENSKKLWLDSARQLGQDEAAKIYLEKKPGFIKRIISNFTGGSNKTVKVKFPNNQTAYIPSKSLSQVQIDHPGTIVLQDENE